MSIHSIIFHEVLIGNF